MILTIRYGFRNTTRTFTVAPTVEQLKRDPSLRTELGYGDNVRVLVNGVEQPNHVQIPGPSVTLETAANQKA